MSATIPNDIMTAARFVAADMDDDPWCETRALKIARALLSERESATKAEREMHEKLTSELAIWVYGAVTCKDWHWDGDQKFAAMECLVSAHEAGYLAQYPMAEVAAAIRKGDGE